MSSEISLLENISYLLKVNYDNNLLSFNEYNQIKGSLNSLTESSLYRIYNKLKYLKDQNDSKYNISTNQLIAQQNQLIAQQNLINQQQNQINSIVNIFNNDFNLEDDLRDDEIKSRFNNEANDRRSLVNTQQEYLPRLNHPVMQSKQPRNSFEIDYQNCFQQRNNFSEKNISNVYDNIHNTNSYESNEMDNSNYLNVYNKKDFYDQEKKREEQFIRSQNIRKKMFEEKARRRRTEFETSLNEVNNNIDPYQILGCNPNCNIEEIKKSYRNLALKHHPDRGGNAENFQLITKAYLSLIEEYKKKQGEKNYMDLKNSSTNFVKEQSNNPKQNVQMNSDNFNIKLFNKIYTENRIADPNDEGYDNWLKDNNDEEEQPKIFSEKFNINVFNSVFENSKNSGNTQDIIEYKDPTPTNINNELAYNNLGEGNISDFSGNSNNLNYTDLKYAHTKTKLIDTRNVNIKNYNNVEDLEKDRSNVRYEMDEDELVEYQLKKKREELDEYERRKRLSNYENKHFDNYNKVHKMLIGNK